MARHTVHEPHAAVGGPAGSRFPQWDHGTTSPDAVPMRAVVVGFASPARDQLLLADRAVGHDHPAGRCRLRASSSGWSERWCWCRSARVIPTSAIGSSGRGCGEGALPMTAATPGRGRPGSRDSLQRICRAWVRSQRSYTPSWGFVEVRAGRTSVPGVSPNPGALDCRTSPNRSDPGRKTSRRRCRPDAAVSSARRPNQTHRRLRSRSRSTARFAC